MKLSVIIPARNEEGFIAKAINSAWDCEVHEVIVSDGGSSDQTVDIAKRCNAKVVDSVPGRGTQMNTGAQAATGDVFLFLHADNWLSLNCRAQIETAFEEGHPFCCFKQRIDADSYVYRLIEKGNALRARYQRLPYGDQGICVSGEVFHQVGGYEEIPLMEDVSFAKKASAITRPQLLEGPIYVSQRRWSKNGPIRQTFSNWMTMLKYRMGVCPEKLARQYYGN